MRKLVMAAVLGSILGGAGDAAGADPIAIGSWGGVHHGLSGAKGSWTFFTITVPYGATRLEVATAGGTGDADLYLGIGAAPTLDDWAMHPDEWGNHESIDLALGAGDTFWIGLYGYADYSAVTLSVAVDYFDSAETLLPYSWVRDLAGLDGSWRYYRVYGGGTGSLRVRVQGGSGDVTVYVKKHVKPSIGLYDAKSLGFGTWHDVLLDDPGPGIYYIGLRAGWAGYGDVDLQVTTY